MMKDAQWHKFLTVARKSATALVGVIAAGLSMGLFKEPWNSLALAIVAVATYYGVYKIPNRPSPTQTPSDSTKSDSTSLGV